MDSAPLDTAALIREHQAGVWRYLRFLGCPPAEADDLTQDTFLAVLRNPIENHGFAAVAAYLRTVARHRLLKARERTRVAVSLEELEQAEALWVKHAAHDAGESYLETMRGCLTKLDERSRHALDLQFAQRFTRAQIASTLGLTEDGAKSLLKRARAALRACVERNHTP